MNTVKKMKTLVVIAFSTVLLQGCFEAPNTESTQTGYRGTGMLSTKNEGTVSALKVKNELPPMAAAIPDNGVGPRARDVFQNVQVLGDLSVAEFTTTMVAITEWVAPEQGCTYCHAGANFAEDDLYTKTVSRRMMQMTRDINANWQSHVGDTGVTCLTCHRGNNVPEYIWFNEDGPETASGMSAKSYQQNHAAMDVGSTSMLSDPFSKYLQEDPAPIRVVAQNALPYKNTPSKSSTQATEDTYSLMIHMSESLGVNCTACHNTRAFTSWEQSPPARMTAWHGLQMVPELNKTYLEPLGSTYPEHRLGALGDAPKVSCATCHQGVNKPFYGESMLDAYPAWKGAKSE